MARHARGIAALVLSAPRLRRLGIDRAQPASVALPDLAPERIEHLALHPSARTEGPVRAVCALEAAALELARLALMLPAVVVVPVGGPEPGILRSEPMPCTIIVNPVSPKLRLSAARRSRWKAALDTSSSCFAAARACATRWPIIVGKPDLAEPGHGAAAFGLPDRRPLRQR